MPPRGEKPLFFIVTAAILTTLLENYQLLRNISELLCPKFRTAHAITSQAPAHLRHHKQPSFQRHRENIFRMATSNKAHINNFMDTDSLFNPIFSIPTIASRKAFNTVHKDLYHYDSNLLSPHVQKYGRRELLTLKLKMSEGV